MPERVLLMTGDGKGKSTAAFGTILRSLGYGWRVALLQFVKSDSDVGELRLLRKFSEVEIHVGGRGFLPRADAPELAEHVAAAQATLELARERLAGGQHEVVVLDEVCLAVARGLIAEADVIEMVDRASSVCRLVVLTGRNATPNLIERADTVTEMRLVKHAFDQGIAAMDGVER